MPRSAESRLLFLQPEKIPGSPPSSGKVFLSNTKYRLQYNIVKYPSLTTSEPRIFIQFYITMEIEVKWKSTVIKSVCLSARLVLLLNITVKSLLLQLRMSDNWHFSGRKTKLFTWVWGCAELPAASPGLFKNMLKSVWIRNPGSRTRFQEKYHSRSGPGTPGV